jgi:hypothetical protein
MEPQKLCKNIANSKLPDMPELQFGSFLAENDKIILYFLEHLL